MTVFQQPSLLLLHLSKSGFKHCPSTFNDPTSAFKTLVVALPPSLDRSARGSRKVPAGDYRLRTFNDTSLVTRATVPS